MKNHFLGSAPSLPRAAVIFAAALLMVSTSAGATQVSLYSFNGTLGTVSVDTGTGTLAGAGVGTSFSGTFMYGASSADIDVTEPFLSGTETGYDFFSHRSGGIFGHTLQ